MTDNARSNRRINAAENTFVIINYIRDHGEATLGELTAELGLTKSTVHTYLMTMIEQGYIQKQENTYSLSLKFLDLGEAVRRNTGIIDIVRESLQNIVEQTDGIAWFIVEESKQAVFVEKAMGDDAVQPYGYVGKRTTFHDIAGGKAILAHLPKESIEEILNNRGLIRRTDQTIIDREELFDNLETIRDRGYSINDGENLEGWRAVASPIIHDGEVLGSIAASGPAHQLRGEWFTDQIPDIVLDATNEIQLQILSQ